MNFKSFDRFFVFVLALSAALYFFGAKPYPEQSLSNATSFISVGIVNYDHMDQGSSLPPVGTETKEEKTVEDDEPTDEDESADHDDSGETSSDQRTSSVSIDEVISQSQRADHCALYIRLRSILI